MMEGQQHHSIQQGLLFVQRWQQQQQRQPQNFRQLVQKQQELDDTLLQHCSCRNLRRRRQLLTNNNEYHGQKRNGCCDSLAQQPVRRINHHQTTIATTQTKITTLTKCFIALPTLTKKGIIITNASLLLLLFVYSLDAFQHDHTIISLRSLRCYRHHHRSTFIITTLSTSAQRYANNVVDDGSDDDVANIKKKNSNHRRKPTPRFVQKQSLVSNSRPTLLTKNVTNDDYKSFRGNSDNDDNASSSSKKVRSSSLPNNKNDLMWKTTKSIEELEDTLLKRYGSDLSKWTASDTDEYDDDDDNDDDDDDIRKPKMTSSQNKITTTTTTSSSSLFRAKPVMDPFLLWDVQQDNEKNKKMMNTKGMNDMMYDDDDSKEYRTNQQQMEQSNRDDMILRRIQTYQQRLTQKQQPQKSNSDRTAKRNDYDNDNDRKQMSINSNHDKRLSEMNFHHLINAEEPVGGLGTNQIQKQKSSSNNSQPSLQPVLPKPRTKPETRWDTVAGDDNDIDNDEDSSRMLRDATPAKGNAPKTFFFSSPPPMHGSDGNEYNDDDQIEHNMMSNDKKQRIEKVKRELVPLYNDDDERTQMFLTLEQAKRNYQKMMIKQQQQRHEVASHPDDTSVAALTTKTTTDDHIRTQALSMQTMQVTWEDIGITDKNLLYNLRKQMSCPQPLYVQQQTCPVLIPKSNTDIVIGTYTGSGKTLAFVLPLIQRLINEKKEQDPSLSSSSSGFVKVLIMAPGRELASQIVNVIRDVIRINNDDNNNNINVALAIGGTTFTRNLETIRRKKPSILVGTPGRIRELFLGREYEKGGRIKISNIQTIILDECDALLQYQIHREPTIAILETLQKYKNIQTIFCSATSTDMMKAMNNKSSNQLLFQQYMKPNYKMVIATNHVDGIQQNTADDEQDTTISAKKMTAMRISPTIIHGVIHVEHKRYIMDTIRKILHTEPIPQQILIFVANSNKVDRLVKQLYAEYNIIAAPLHGDSDKLDRMDVNAALRNGKVGIVVATEMAARGLDAPLLTHVINVDIPTDMIHYAHRAGRCGRGKQEHQNQYGVVLTLTTSPAERNVPYKLLNQMNSNYNNKSDDDTKYDNAFMYTVSIKNGKLNIIDPRSLDL